MDLSGDRANLADVVARAPGAVAAAMAVRDLTDEWGPPTVQEVADALGLGRNATWQRLQKATAFGLLVHREGTLNTHGCYRASERLQALSAVAP